MSRPSRTRGLKHLKDKIDQGITVASLADAWIETRGIKLDCTVREVASLADAWIETGDR